MAAVELTVNGARHRVQADPALTLLAWLRDGLGLTGTKSGCGQGHCGACMVIVNGQAQRACLLRLARLDGARVETIEALATPTTVHALQYAFVHQGAVQCGYCTPGMIMAAKALLDRNPDPDDAAIRAALQHNLCRCTGYIKIVRAVREAAALLRRGEVQVPRARLDPPLRAAVGASLPRREGLEKATGALRYTGDLSRPGQLWGKALRSPFPHAELQGIDVSRARRLPGVAAVLTAADVPGDRLFGVITADQPVLAVDRVRYVGDAVAVAFAETLAQAEVALEAIEVRWRELPVIGHMDEALQPGAPLLHPGGNVLSQVLIAKGDVERGLAEAEVIVEGTYRTPFVEHAYLEPEACMAEPDGQGGVIVYVGSQGPWSDRRQIAAALALPAERVRVAHMPVGGAFGGKEDITLQILAALGATVTGRPVKMVMDRAESIAVSSKRHAQTLRYRTGARRDGRLTAMDVEIVADTGAYASLGQAVLFRSATFACGPYVLPHLRVRAQAVYTNNVPCGAMRGFGSPQVAFAVESQMDELARRLGIDPISLRELNALRAGESTATGEVLTASVGAEATLAALRQALGGVKRPQVRPGRRLGVGVAACYKNVGLGGGLPDEAEAHLTLQPDGSLLLRVGCADLGQGAETAMAQIVAEATGVPVAAITVHAGDTSLDPPCGMTTASRETFITGNAALAAAEAWRERALAAAAQVLGCAPAELTLRDGHFALAEGEASSLLTLEALARQAEDVEAHGHYAAQTDPYRLPAPGETSTGRLHCAYCFGAQAALVEVDEGTGEVDVLHLVAAHDAGRIINPQAVEGQIEGGLMMGLGYALTEEFALREGRVVTDTLRRLGIPGIARMPEITTVLVENPHPEGPLGAKGMAELPTAGTAPAILNAIRAAIGVRIRDLPARPELVLAALQEQAGTKQDGDRRLRHSDSEGER